MTPSASVPVAPTPGPPPNTSAQLVIEMVEEVSLSLFVLF